MPRVALLVGELYARVTSDSSDFRRDMEKVDAQGAKSAAQAAANARKIEASRKAELDAAGKVRVAEAQLDELRAQKGNVAASKVAAAEERLAAARRALDAATQNTIRLEQQSAEIRERETIATNKAAEATRVKAERDADAARKTQAKAAAEALATREAERGDRSSMKFAATLLGLGAAGGVAGAGIVAGLAGVPVILAGLAAASLSSQDEVLDAWQATTSELADGVQDIAGPMKDELVTAADQVTAGFRKMRPELKAMAAEGGPAVTMLIDGVLKLATNALPGMRKSVQESGTAVAGLNALLDHSGTGLSKFFAEISTGAPSAGRNMGELGLIIEDLLGTGGKLVALLSNDFQGSFARLRGVIDQTTDSVEGLAQGGFPALSAAGSTLIGVAASILGAIGPIAPQLGSIIGIMLSAKAGAAVFGAAGDVIGRVGDKMQTAGEKSGKAGGAVRGLGSALSFIGPYGAAAGAVLLGFSSAADKAFGSMDELTAKLMAGGNAAAQAREKLAMNDVMQGTAESLGALTSVWELFVPTTRSANEEVTKARSSMTSLQRAQIDASAAAADHSRAVELFGKNSSQAQAASAILAMRQQDLKNAQYEAAQATKTLVDRMQEQLGLSLLLAGNNLALRMSTTAYEQAQANLNKTLSSGTATTLEIKAAKEQVEQASLRVIDAAGKEALAHYANQGSVEAQTASMHAQQAKALELAATFEGPLPLALQTVVANMDDASLSAAGATRTIDSTGAAVIRLPNGKEIRIEANDQATYKIDGVHNKLNSLPSTKWIDIFINEVITTSSPNTNPANLPLPFGGNADGGPVKAGQMSKVGERGEETVMFPANGYVFTAAETRMIDQMVKGGGPSIAPPRTPADDAIANGAPTSGRTVVIKELHMHQVRTLPTAQELRNVLHDVEVEYGA